MSFFKDQSQLHPYRVDPNHRDPTMIGHLSDGYTVTSCNTYIVFDGTKKRIVIIFLMVLARFARTFKVGTKESCVNTIAFGITVIFIKSHYKHRVLAKGRLLDTWFQELFEPLCTIVHVSVVCIILELLSIYHDY